jgi:hypothetical protein
MGRKAINPVFADDSLRSAKFYARCGIPMKITVGAFAAFLLGGALFSQQAEARCWWTATIIAATTIMGGGTTAGIITAIGTAKEVAHQ